MALVLRSVPIHLDITMFTLTGYSDDNPCLLCSCARGTFTVTSLRNEINGSLCTKCLTRIVKARSERETKLAAEMTPTEDSQPELSTKSVSNPSDRLPLNARLRENHS